MGVNKGTPGKVYGLSIQLGLPLMIKGGRPGQAWFGEETFQVMYVLCEGVHRRNRIKRSEVHIQPHSLLPACGVPFRSVSIQFRPRRSLTPFSSFHHLHGRHSCTPIHAEPIKNHSTAYRQRYVHRITPFLLLKNAQISAKLTSSSSEIKVTTQLYSTRTTVSCVECPTIRLN
jgi:hypothetical protein